ncbi:SDR family NAD(P)-dependent oxidoreductase [Streptomyces sp. NPDC001927]
MSERRLALVTGAAGGIGLEVSRRLAARGHTVIVVDRDATLTQRAAAGIAPAGIPVVCDLTDPTDVSALVRSIENEWAQDLDVLICNAGVIVPGDVTDLATEQIDLQIDVMLRSVLHVVAGAARVFKQKNEGHILATVSTGGILALPGSATYSAAKAGVRAYLAALHAELRDTDVAVSGIYVSAVDTPMLHHEATHGGSVLNFVGTVTSVDKVADRYDRVLRTRRLETYLPYGDSIVCRTLECFPWILPRLLTVLNKIGERGRKRYLLRQKAAASQPL